MRKNIAEFWQEIKGIKRPYKKIADVMDGSAASDGSDNLLREKYSPVISSLEALGWRRRSLVTAAHTSTHSMSLVGGGGLL